MKLGILFSGGKDSCYAMFKASKQHEISCLLSMESMNPESYMFHTPNISMAELQANAMAIPFILQRTLGKKELELKDLKKLLKRAKKEFNIEGIVTGAVASVYQASRIQRVCFELNLWCFNPLWQMDQMQLLREIVDNKFEVLIVGVFGYPLDQTVLGKTIDNEMIKRLAIYNKKYQLNPAGEGGEYETFVLDCPMFKKKIEIEKTLMQYNGNNDGIFIIEGAKVTERW